MDSTFGKIIKIFSKLFIVAVVLTVIYPGVDFAFKTVLSPLSRAVLSNFILFALIIGLVMKQVVHPKSMLEKAQTAIEDEIKASELAKETSEEKLTSIQKSSRNVKKEVAAILEKSEENAQLVGAKILEDAEKTALIVKENADKAIENSQLLIKNDLIRRASLASVEVARAHILNELNVNVELHDKLIDESIEALIVDEKEEVEEV